MSVWCLTLCLLAASPSGQDESILKNGGFESCVEVPANAGGAVKGWRFSSSQVPAAWTPNPAYPGELTVCTSEPDKPAARGGERFVRIAGVHAGSAHVYQMCQGLEPGKWYRVSAWVRGGAVSLSFYEYFKSLPWWVIGRQDADFAPGTEVEVTISRRVWSNEASPDVDDEALTAARARMRELFGTIKGFRMEPKIPREELHERGSLR